MSPDMPIQGAPNRIPKAVPWIVIVALVAGVIGLSYYVYQQDNGKSNTNAAVNTSISNTISISSTHELVLEAKWQQPVSNISHDIYTTFNDDGVSLKVILVDEQVSKTHSTPTQYLEARSFEFPSSYAEVVPNTATPQEYAAAKRVFEYNDGANSLVALALDVNGILVLLEVSGPTTGEIESVASAIASTIRTNT